MAFDGGIEEVRRATSASCISGPRPASDIYVVWRLTSRRHYKHLPSLPPVDRLWEQKKNAAIFRGNLSGKRRDGFRRNMKASDQEKCMLMHRCRLVLNAANSSLVDARLTPKPPPEIVADKVGDVQLSSGRASFEHMLKYKAIIMLEGNDISSGFKWALYSNSVVMTQKPTLS